MSGTVFTDHIPGDVVELAAGARNVVVLTGAGISAESGVPTFRDARTGLWENYSPEDLATPEAFEADPELVWSWYLWRARLLRTVSPNPGHHGLADWQQWLTEHGGRLRISTQNVDDLHEQSGATVLAHLHGKLDEYRCAACGRPAAFNLADHIAEDFKADGAADEFVQLAPPRCPHCAKRGVDGLVRPGVVWFGEMLPTDAYDNSAEAVRGADLVVVAGTSGIVHPAAGLPLLALERGTPLIEINPEETELSDVMDVVLRGKSGHVLPELVARIRAAEPAAGNIG